MRLVSALTGQAPQACEAGPDDSVKQEFSKVEIRMQDLKYQQNSLLPVSRLPPEILQTVFVHCQYFDNGSAPLLFGQPAWLSLLRVCHYWRQVALEFAWMWTCPDLRFPKLAEDMIRRAKNLPLAVEWAHYPDEAPPCHIRALWDALSHLPRIARLSVRLNKHCVTDFMASMSRPALLLHTLEVHLDRARAFTYTIPDSFLSGQAPLLRSLSLSGLDLPWESPILRATGLRTLHLFPNSDFQFRPSVSQLLRVLADMPNLQVLELVGMRSKSSYKADNSTVPSVAHLPFLRRLRLGTCLSSDCMNILRRLSFPRDTELRLTVRYDLFDADEMVSAHHSDEAVPVFFEELNTFLSNHHNVGGDDTGIWRHASIGVYLRLPHLFKFGVSKTVPAEGEFPTQYHLKVRIVGKRGDEVSQQFTDAFGSRLKDVESVACSYNSYHWSGNILIYLGHLVPKLHTLLLIDDPPESIFKALAEGLVDDPPPSDTCGSLPSTGAGPRKASQRHCAVPFPALRTLILQNVDRCNYIDGYMVLTATEFVDMVLEPLSLRSRHGTPVASLILGDVRGLNEEEVEPLKAVTNVEWDQQGDYCYASTEFSQVTEHEWESSDSSESDSEDSYSDEDSDEDSDSEEDEY
ncbi:hypothetical protein V5O48_016025 [Marasmius crinis-equi]|uniref:F-box domain-containing protein n=1 Tax=Marasmius crinis-equi TaxID=585013 RepID=A0ABR3ESW5_9AGAR